ncbi:hypothetical protein Poli38472_000798 [Pythium oligandrum]|uniref:HTH CENPB-type domain-containing protein n=1 Tax=Pythium oligandrum TaxID=41045 RepID=A0A8K1CCD4_PYTOL|nr:hypothetical protein Poli38472_000798 [Pythium oligandrum]|eukprot:TMW60756.1 hypothetical protein Poli38472_000798 [Pythium oligandrum]
MSSTESEALSNGEAVINAMAMPMGDLTAAATEFNPESMVETATSALVESAAIAALPPSTPGRHKTRSTNLTHEQKRLICLYAKQNPTFTQAQLGKWAKDHFGLPSVPSQSSISHTLKRRQNFEHMKSEDWSSKRMRTVKFPDLDTALANWFLYCQARQTRIQGDEIKAKAATFFELMYMPVTKPPQFSNGWLHSFQSRHGFSRSPSTHTTETELISTRHEFLEATKGYAPWDVYWMDETRLEYALLPEKVGHPVDNDKQLTLALCCNADGSEMLDPFFVASAPVNLTVSPPVSVDYGFTYAHNMKVWMTPTVFREWLLALDWKMHEENRSILLLLDSFSSHQVKKLTLKNVTVRFVAQTATGQSYLEPVEQTLMTAFKTRYRQYFLEYLLNQKTDGSEVSPLHAIQWVIKCWRELPKALVTKVFADIGIANDESPTSVTGDATEELEAKLREEVVALIKRLKLKTPDDLADFIYPLSERIIDEDLTDQDFVQSALDGGLSTTVEGKNVEPPRKVARIARLKKTGISAGNESAMLLMQSGSAGIQVQTVPVRSVGRMTATGDDITVPGGTVIPEEEWQAWADSHRYRIDELHALETVIRLANEMNCDTSTLVDLGRIQAELLQKRQAGERSVPAAQADAANSASGSSDNGKQSAGICRFNFGAGSTVV